MDDNLKQIAILFTAFAVPILLLLFKQQRILLAWVGVTLLVHIFDTSIYTNLAAGRLVGLAFFCQVRFSR
ncbi:MAG: hypothetical protein IPM55_19950 [Acidobacteria bacterium]|nr:hypothetical protein [Acidobacteriota bacterium]